MSASNYAVCPRCVARARASADAQVAQLNADYGAIPLEEFDQRRAQIPEVHSQDYCTFREDYEIYGAATGTVKVDYSGTCSACGLELSFTDERPIPGVTP
jgi:hypothetical protein